MTTSDPIAPTTPVDALLTDDMLARFDERAPALRPREPVLRRGLGGAEGVRLPARPRCPRSSAAPGSRSTSTRSWCGGWRTSPRRPRSATNMHCYWTGVAADLLKGGDESCRFILEQAAAGEVFARCTARPATTCRCCSRSRRAERVDGGWEISGHKIFGSLTPVWTAAASTRWTRQTRRAADRPRLPPTRHATASRSSRPGTRSACARRRARTRCSTRRSSPTSSCALVCPTGFAGAGMFHVAIFAWALMGFASTYLGAAKPGFDMTVEACRSARRSR